MKNRIKTIIALILSLPLAFTGCAANSPSPSTSASPLPNWNGGKMPVTLKAPLYFLSEDGTHFAIMAKDIQAQEDETRTEALVWALIEGPSGDYKSILPANTQVDWVEESTGIINVFLSGSFPGFTPEDYLIAKTAIADTLIDAEGVDYVNVYINGILPDYMGIPTGPATRYTEDIATLLNGYAAQGQAMEEEGAITSTAVLYFRDESGQYLIPQAVPVQYDASDNVQTIIQALIKGPKTGSGLKAVLPPDLTELEPPTLVDNADGTRTAILNFSGLPILSDAASQVAEVLPYASLSSSITGNLPNVRDIIVKLNGKPVTGVPGADFLPDGRIQRELFHELTGNHITLYFPDKEFKSLITIKRCVPQRLAMDPSTRISELMRGPLEAENESAWPVFPGGVALTDLAGVQISGNTVVINFTYDFKRKCEGLSAAGENMLVYSMVNSMTEMAGIRRIQFIFDGKIYASLAGHIHMQTPLMRNPGLIMKEPAI